MFAALFLVLQQADPLTRLGAVGTFGEYAFGRNSEPIDGDVYLSPDGGFAVGQSPTTRAFSYFWRSSKPTEYSPMRFGAAYDAKRKRGVIYTIGKGNADWLTFGTCKVEAVLSDRKVIVRFSGRDRTGVGRALVGIVTPGEDHGKVLIYFRNEFSGQVYVDRDGNVWAWDHEMKRLREAREGKSRLLPKGSAGESILDRFYIIGNFEIDRKTGSRTEVKGRNDQAQYWSEHLIITRNKEFFLWDRASKKLVSIGPAMPVMGKDYRGKQIVFRTDSRKGVVREHKMLTIDR